MSRAENSPIWVMKANYIGEISDNDGIFMQHIWAEWRRVSNIFAKSIVLEVDSIEIGKK